MATVRPGDALEIEGVGCRRGGRRVLADVTARIAPGEAVALRGPNGVGKSTLLRVIAGFLPAEAGEVRLGVAALSEDRAGFQARIAYAGHLDAVKAPLTVADNLSLWASIYDAEEDRPARVLERFGLAHMAERPAGECSAGQKRRLGLARLLVMNRPVWLLDEPTVSLDKGSSDLVAEILADHVAAGGLALVATHIALGLTMRALELSPPPPEAPDAAEDPFLEGSW